MKVARMAIVMALCAALVAASCGGGMDHDDFNDNAINPSCWTAYCVGSGPTVSETNRRLEIVIPSNSTDDPSKDVFAAGYTSVYLLRGDFDMQVDYQLINWPYENGVRIGLGVEVAPTTHERGYPVERISFGRNDFSGQPREVYLTDFGDGQFEVTATSNCLGKLRLVRTGAILSGYYYSNDSWILVHAGLGPAADVCIVIPAWSHEYCFADQEVKIAFDNFVINQGDLVCGE